MDKIKTILYSTLAIFILIVTFFFVPEEFPLKRKLFIVVAILGLLFLILGVILIILGRKERGKLRIFLLITGISAICPLVFTILHNFFYALGIIFESLSFLFEILHATSFIISLLVAPIVFIIGLIGSLILIKNS